MTRQNAATETPLTLGQWIGFFSMAIGVFMAVLDIQIVASSLQKIQAGLSATKDEIAWVQTSYLIAEVIIIPLSGWLGRVFLDPLFICHVRGRLHASQPAVRIRLESAVDDRVPLFAGLSWRRDDSDDLYRDLHFISSAPATGDELSCSD